MDIEEIKSGSSIQLNVNGNIDTFSSDEFQNYLLSVLQRCTILVVNLEKVERITSAGLRALLLGQKTAQSKGGSLTVINASDSILDVFRVTGFDKLLVIR